MMSSSNGSIFRFTGHLCGEFTGHRWIPHIKPLTRSFDVFCDLRLNKRLNKQLLPVGWHSKPPVLSSTTPPWASCQIRKIAGCACVGNAGNVFPYTDFKGNHELAIPACVTHEPWCMSGSITRGGGENVPGIPGACTTRNLTYLARDPYNSFWSWVMWSYQWSPLPMLEEVPDGEYVGQGIVWTAFDVGKSCVRQIEQGTALYHNLVEPCSTPLPIQDGTSLRSSGTQCNRRRWLHIVCGDNRALWRPGVSVTVLLDALHWSHSWRPIRQSSDGVVPEITHHVDGSRLQKRWRATAWCGKSKFAISCGWLKIGSVSHPDDIITLP